MSSDFNSLLRSLGLDPAACGSLTMAQATKLATKSGLIRHRACDECRMRKLACSKDPGGCQRCKRENILCHYSENKKMGRPRKRQFIEVAQDEQNTTEGQDDEITAILANVSNYSVPHLISEASYPPEHITTSFQVPKSDDTERLWSLDDRGHLDGTSPGFNELSSDESNNNLVIDQTPLQAKLALIPPLLEQNANVNGPCSCLASMYLALASLQQFPTEIVPALASIRGAARTASNTLYCPQCGFPDLDNTEAPIEGFQNTMLLGTILPVIANGYKRLLRMIDTETELAISTGRTKKFRFHDYGGLCGRETTATEAIDCATKEFLFDEVDMLPDQWRYTVRRLLRTDIYGIDHPDFKLNHHQHHRGLRQLISEVEERQIARHAIIAVREAAGITTPGQYGARLAKKCAEDRAENSSFTCLQIIRIAKEAIDDIDIPA